MARTDDLGGQNMKKGRSFRHSAGFGKRIEHWIIGLMLKEGMDVYVPLVDDHAIDAIVLRRDSSTAAVQVKARSKEVGEGAAALFAAIPHERVRRNYWFVFYSERMNKIFVMTSREFLRESRRNKSGKNVGLRSIWFNGKRQNRETGKTEEYVKPQFEKYVASDFTRIRKFSE